jgi:hypothetical protein
LIDLELDELVFTQNKNLINVFSISIRDCLKFQLIIFKTDFVQCKVLNLQNHFFILINNYFKIKSLSYQVKIMLQ